MKMKKCSCCGGQCNYIGQSLILSETLYVYECSKCELLSNDTQVDYRNWLIDVCQKTAWPHSNPEAIIEHQILLKKCWDDKIGPIQTADKINQLLSRFEDL